MFFNECIANARGQPLQYSAAKLLVVSQAVGYDAALHAAVITLSVLKSTTNAWPESEDREAEAYVLSALDLIPAIPVDGLGYVIGPEGRLVRFFERLKAEPGRGALSPSFRAAALAKYRSPAVNKALRAHGAMKGGVALVASSDAGHEVRRRADVAARGFRTCALPACLKPEASWSTARAAPSAPATRPCRADDIADANASSSSAAADASPPASVSSSSSVSASAAPARFGTSRATSQSFARTLGSTGVNALIESWTAHAKERTIRSVPWTPRRHAPWGPLNLRWPQLHRAALVRVSLFWITV